MSPPTGSRRINGDSAPHSWPIFRSLKNYAAADASGDLIAGLTLAAIAIPEQIATARLGGFSPEAGFSAFVAGSVGFAAFGANRFLSAGADSTITPIFGGGLLALMAWGAAQYGQLAALLAVIVGIILIGGGLFRLGWIADLLSIPVTTGFLAGIAIHIVVSQLPALLGIAAPTGSLIDRLRAIISALDGANPYALALGLGVLFVMLAAEWISARIPGALIALATATAAVAFFGLDQRGVAILGPIEGGFPAFAIPTMRLDQIIHILPLALMVALVVMVQTAATTRSFASSLEDPDVNRDFAGIGAGNILAGLFGAFPVNASPPRTGIVLAVGGRSQLASLAAAGIVLGLSIFGMKLLVEVPEAGLAGLLLFVAMRLIRVRDIVDLYRQTAEESLLIAATALAIVVLPIEVGVAIGILLSLIHGMWTTTRARTIELQRVPGTSIWWPPSPTHPGESLPGVCVVAFQGPLAFVNAYEFRRGFLSAVDRRGEALRLVVLEASNIVAIDYTAAKVLAGVIRHYQLRGMTIAISRLESVRAWEAFERFGIMKLVGEDHVFHSVEEAVKSCAGNGATPPETPRQPLAAHSSGN